MKKRKRNIYPKNNMKKKLFFYNRIDICFHHQYKDSTLHKLGAEKSVVSKSKSDLASVGGILHLEEGLDISKLSDDGHVIIKSNILLGSSAHVALDTINAVLHALRGDIILLALDSLDGLGLVDGGLASSNTVEGLKRLVHEVAHVAEDLTVDLTSASTIEHTHDATDGVPGEDLALKVDVLELAQRDGAAAILIVLVEELGDRINRWHAIALLRRHTITLLRRHAIALLRRHTALRGHTITLLRRHTALRRHTITLLRRHTTLLRRHTITLLRRHTTLLRHARLTRLLRRHSIALLGGHSVALLRRHSITLLSALLLIHYAINI